MSFIFSEELTGRSPSAGREFGKLSAMQDQFLIVSQEDPGALYLYQKDGNTWQESDFIDSLTPSSLSLDRRTVAASDGSLFYVYSIDSNISLSEIYNEDISDEIKDVAIGSSFSAASTLDTESVRVYHIEDEEVIPYSGGALSPDDVSTGDQFGFSLCTQGDFLIVGSPGQNNFSGAVYVYVYDYASGTWEMSEKIVPEGLSEGDYFGYDVCYWNDYLFVSSPFLSDGENLQCGAVFVYRMNGYFQEVDRILPVSDYSTSGYNFGKSLSSDNRFLSIGAPGVSPNGKVFLYSVSSGLTDIDSLEGESEASDGGIGENISISGGMISVCNSEKSSSEGSVYIYYSDDRNITLAQGFVANGEFIPSKASIYLEKIGQPDRSNFLVQNGKRSVIDASNFSEVSKGSSRVLFRDDEADFTGSGYMWLPDVVGEDYDLLQYPIQLSQDATLNLWIRCGSLSDTDIDIDIYIDGIFVKNIADIDIQDSGSVFGWSHSIVVIPDSDEHVLGIKMKESGNILDKIYIDFDYYVPISQGPEYSISPYVTSHVRISDSHSDASPNSFLYAYDTKSTYKEIKCNDWYNFDITLINNLHSFLDPGDFNGSYFIVLNTSGAYERNFLLWRKRNVEPGSGPVSAIRI